MNTFSEVISEVISAEAAVLSTAASTKEVEDKNT